MSDVIANIIAITDRRDFPCCDRVNMWHIVSRDPDENSDGITGTLAGETVDDFYVIIDGEETPTPFRKYTTGGVRLWRADHIGGHG